MWKCIWFPVVHAMPIHHIGVFHIYSNEGPTVVAFIQWVYVFHCTIPPNEDSLKSVSADFIFLKT